MIWLYHKDEIEGKIFKLTDDIEALIKQGWVDTPAKIATEIRDEFAELKERAVELGLTISRNMKLDTIKAKIQEAEEALNDGETTN